VTPRTPARSSHRSRRHKSSAPWRHGPWLILSAGTAQAFNPQPDRRFPDPAARWISPKERVWARGSIPQRGWLAERDESGLAGPMSSRYIN